MKQYELDFLSAEAYFCSNLTDTNQLSYQILKLVNFREGHFFTFLPMEKKRENIHSFQEGSRIYGLKDYSKIWILDKLLAESGWSCIFDDQSST